MRGRTEKSRTARVSALAGRGITRRVEIIARPAFGTFHEALRARFPASRRKLRAGSPCSPESSRGPKKTQATGRRHLRVLLPLPYLFLYLHRPLRAPAAADKGAVSLEFQPAAPVPGAKGLAISLESKGGVTTAEKPIVLLGK